MCPATTPDRTTDRYVEWAPPPALAGRVACLWAREAGGARVQRVVPDGCVDLIWGPEGAYVAGPDTTAFLAPMRAGERLTALRFRPGAVGDVFGVPVEELRDRRVSLADLPGMEPRGPGDIQRVVAARFRESAEPDASVPAVMRALRQGTTVGRVAWDLGLSERQLNRRCRAAFGYGPKILQRVVRFQRALALARSGVRPADVAAACGYADQAHMANDVRRLAGTSLGHLLGGNAA
ncbi:helix-turn-helix transcriptional regulator [Sphaerisporangium fuscum]|uniref:helix-turn-helix transcriptional regulator n=1 Tax=Sphaerisporangium fuscum TaxID=2835868 RepID=UPI001BDC8BB3|nr:helix-turn-helix transcriptional regulator [Sphaerisporangium fuscum]